jgi:hypothetical protein
MGLLVSAEAGRGRQGCAARNKFTTKVYDEAGDPFGLERNEKKTLRGGTPLQRKLGVLFLGNFGSLERAGPGGSVN